MSGNGAVSCVNDPVAVSRIGGESSKVGRFAAPQCERRKRDLAEALPAFLTPVTEAPCAEVSSTPTTAELPNGVAPMTWTRLDDGWTDRPVFDQIPYDIRWHYLALVQFCSRNSRYDGRIRAVDARRCSDVDDPATALAVLAAAGLIDVGEEGWVLIPQIAEHVPPPSMRDENRKERRRNEKRRSRLHAKGEHIECLPGNCDKAVSSESEGGSSPSRPVLSRPGVSTDMDADMPSEQAARLDALARARTERGWEA